jgi:glutathione S-transferase
MEAGRPAFKFDMEAHLQIAEDMLKDHQFLLSEKPSLADFAVFGAINPLRYSGNELPESFSKLYVWSGSIDRI